MWMMVGPLEECQSVCQSLHSDDVEEILENTRMNWSNLSGLLFCFEADVTPQAHSSYPHTVVYVLLLGIYFQTVHNWLNENPYEVSHSVLIDKCFSSPWLTAQKESGSPLQRLLLTLFPALFILLLREYLSRNLELIGSQQQQVRGEIVGAKLQRLGVRFLVSSAVRDIRFLLISIKSYLLIFK
ncbi:hypothetical protein Tco_0449735 [Tanacetum coccineum]